MVCSESHFSVLFSLQPELLRDWRAERLFDLYYYDGLANQQEQIRLTVGAPPPLARVLGPRVSSGRSENNVDPQTRVCTGGSESGCWRILLQEEQEQGLEKLRALEVVYGEVENRVGSPEHHAHKSGFSSAGSEELWKVLEQESDGIRCVFRKNYAGS